MRLFEIVLISFMLLWKEIDCGKKTKSLSDIHPQRDPQVPTEGASYIIALPVQQTVGTSKGKSVHKKSPSHEGKSPTPMKRSARIAARKGEGSQDRNYEGSQASPHSHPNKVFETSVQENEGMTSETQEGRL